jgi:hypothetical protein
MRQVRNFTGHGVSDETLRAVEEDWHTEIDALEAHVAKYKVTLVAFSM